MPNRKAAAVAAMLVLLLLTVAACGSDDDSTGSSGDSTTGGSSQPTKDVTFLTGFGYGAWDAPYAVAQEKGYFEEAGLNVEIKAGQGTTTNLQLLANGNADFAHTGGGPLAIGVGEGLPVKAIASFIQIAGSGVMTDPDIKSPEEMEGKTFGGSAHDFTTLLLPLYERTVGISGIEVINADPGSFPTIFLQGRVDMMTALEWAEVPQVEAEGKEFNFFSYADAGMNLIGPSVTTSVAALKEDPEAAKAFVEATAKGFEFAYENPEEAAEITKKVWPTTLEKYNEAVVPTLEKFPHTPATEGKALGWMSGEDWKKTIDILVKGEQMDEAIPADQVYENVIPEE